MWFSTLALVWALQSARLGSPSLTAAPPRVGEVAFLALDMRPDGNGLVEPRCPECVDPPQVPGLTLGLSNPWTSRTVAHGFTLGRRDSPLG